MAPANKTHQPARGAASIDRLKPALQSYFQSGWAFFIPYLLAYLLYALLKWPANPNAPLSGGLQSAIPSLLTVFWFLHGAHVLLVSLALHSWWRERRADKADSVSGPQSSAFWSALPWLCLALVVCIPGIYLEWPSDPWEHLRRINEWHAHTCVSAHSTWTKFSYFLPFSLIENLAPSSQITWLNGYATLVSLLLSWQYYRLARAVGLGHRGGIVFVILHTVTFGNSAFSFHRYYGLSSTVLAQIGAIALTRAAVNLLGSKPAKPDLEPGVQVATLKLPTWAHVVSLCLVAVFILFTHIQAAAIAAWGVTAVICWRLVFWRKHSVWWIAGCIVAASIATVLWYPRDSTLFDAYRASGWLSPIFGFNVFAPQTAAFDRALQISGPLGVLSFLCGLWLLARNHVVGWLTVVPLVLLALPCVAIPLTQEIGERGGVAYIVTFHRLVFAVPGQLAAVVVADALFRFTAEHLTARRTSVSAATSALGFLLILPGALKYDRLWHALSTSPSDINLAHITSDFKTHRDVQRQPPASLDILAPLTATLQQAFHPTARWWLFRRVDHSGEKALSQTVAALAPWEAQSDASVNEVRDDSPILLPDVECSRATFARQQTWITEPQLLFDSNDEAATWESLNRVAPRVEFANGHRIIANPRGESIYVFGTSSIKVDSRHRYLLQMDVRETPEHRASNYLAVAWHGNGDKWLRSSDVTPSGAGKPTGWLNGPWSYFGLTGQAARNEWETHSTTFGFTEHRMIPASAEFVRLGALLNYRSDPDVIVELRDIRLWRIPDHSHCTMGVPVSWSLTTPWSAAARLSGHWSPTIVAQHHAGNAELRRCLAAYLSAEGFVRVD